ncbi:putative nuclear envelope pore membrane protein POM 121B [Haliotis asinina]|uniref:putative nuclear envelope pore membrane protein POM 121B n=1 Tax=Haliotis asinina TaxID=109174 RepID=UPI0035320824
MSLNFSTVLTVVFLTLLSCIVFGFKTTLFLYILTVLCVFLLVEGREWTGLLPVRLSEHLAPVADRIRETTGYIGTVLHKPLFRSQTPNMFESWNPLQWLWKGKDGQTPGSRPVMRSKFARRTKNSKFGQSKQKERSNALNSPAPISVSSPKSPKRGLSGNVSTGDLNTSVSVLNASGPLLSTPLMPMIKRAVANTSGHNDTFSPDVSSPLVSGSRSRPVRRANTFHFTPTHPVDSSPGVLPWVRFGRRDRHSLYKADINSFKHQNTVRVAPPDPHRVISPSLMPLKERTDNTPKPVDTQAVVNALRERRKRSLVVAVEDDTLFEESGQHAKRRRQESSQSTASSASLPPMPDNLPDLSDKNVMMQLDEVSLKRPSAPSREAMEEAEQDVSVAKRQKNTRNNPITSSLSSSRRILIRERIEARSKTPLSHLDADLPRSKRRATDQSPAPTTDIPETVDGDSVMTPDCEENRLDAATTESVSQDKSSTPSSKTSTPNRRLQLDGVHKPTRRRNLSLYPGLNSSFAGVPVARVSATADDYEADREAERQRVQDMLEDAETSIKQKSIPGTDAVDSAAAPASSSQTAATISTTSSQQAGISTSSSLLSVPTNTKTLTSVSQTPTLSSTNPLLNTIPTSTTNPLLNSKPTPSTNPLLNTKLAPTTTASQVDLTFKPIFGAVTTGSSASTSTTASVTTPVSSTTASSFNPIFPPAASTAVSTGTSTTTTTTNLVVPTPSTKTDTGSSGLTAAQALFNTFNSPANPPPPYPGTTQVGNAPVNFSSAPAKPSSQVIGILPLTTSTPKPAVQPGFSLSGPTALQFGQTSAPSSTSTASSNQPGSTGLPVPTFSFGQQPAATTTNVTFGGSGSVPATTKDITAGQTTGLSTPAKNLFGAATTASSTASNVLGFGQNLTGSATVNQFGQNTAVSTASSGFQFGQSNSSTAQSSGFQVGSVSTTQAKTSSGPGLFSFGATSAAGTAASFGNTSNTALGVSSTAAPVFGSGSTSTTAFGTGTSAASVFGKGTSSTSAFVSGMNAASPFGTGTSASSAFGSGTNTSAFGTGTSAPSGFGAGASATSAFGLGTSGTAFGSGNNSAPAFGTGSAPGFGSATGTATSAFGTSSGTAAFGSSTGPVAPAFGAGASTTKQNNTGSSTFTFGNTATPSQPAFGSSQAASSVFGAPSNSQDQKQTSVFGAPTTQAGFNFGSTASAFSTGSQPGFGQSSSGFGSTSTPNKNNTPGTFQFGQTSQPSTGENKGFNFNASFTGSPQVNFGTPNTPNTSFGTPSNNMFSATGVPPKPRVAARGRRRGTRR